MASKDVFRKIQKEEQDVTERLDIFLASLDETQDALDNARANVKETISVLRDYMEAASHGATFESMSEEWSMTDEDAEKYYGALREVGAQTASADRDTLRLITSLSKLMDDNYKMRLQAGY